MLLQPEACVLLVRRPGALGTTRQGLNPGFNLYCRMIFVGFLSLSELTLCPCRTGEEPYLRGSVRMKRSHMKALLKYDALTSHPTQSQGSFVK